MIFLIWKSAEKKNFVWTGMEHDIVFPEFESLDIHYVRFSDSNSIQNSQIGV